MHKSDVYTETVNEVPPVVADQSEVVLTLAREFGPEWRLRQRSTIGSSTAARIMGCSRFPPTVQTLWDQMRSAIVDGQPPEPLRENDDMRRGRIAEPLARTLLAQDLGVPIKPWDQHTFAYNRRFPWAHALPDGTAGEHLIEVKVPRPGTIAKCNLEGLLDEWIIQCQHQMAVCDARVVHVGLLDPITIRLHRIDVPRDDDLIGTMMATESGFWDSIKSGCRPPYEQSATDDTPLSNGCLCLDDEQSLRLATAYMNIRGVREEAEDAEEALKERLIALSLGADAFEFRGIMRATHKASAPSRLFDRDKAIKTYPDLTGDAFWKAGKVSRPFRVYDLRT